MGQRPPGVLTRVTTAYAGECSRVPADDGLARRATMARFTTECGYYLLREVGPRRLTETLAGLTALMDDSSQVRTGSAFERASEEGIAAARAAFSRHRRPADELESADLERIADRVALPMMATLFPGEKHGGDAVGRLVCLSETHALVEGAQRPYLCARAIRSVAVYFPQYADQVMLPMKQLSIEWEDQVRPRERTEAMIAELAARYTATTPFAAVGTR
ncbi:hypothetical protein SAMN05444695_104229 [Rhodococcus triatomae]|uniref:Uncharacterized protein n=2 Tax=Rhodococcus triatomae TaxID=300028 RepID=A0A1G8GX55_9NOCA|nr:hypothetical protein SAMN05444695_104229 [Rhodococcus triatomae]